MPAKPPAKNLFPKCPVGTALPCWELCLQWTQNGLLKLWCAFISWSILLNASDSAALSWTQDSAFPSSFQVPPLLLGWDHTLSSKNPQDSTGHLRALRVCGFRAWISKVWCLWEPPAIKSPGCLSKMDIPEPPRDVLNQDLPASAS